MGMDIQNIRAFLMIAETRSFSRAAERLFITQPAISKRIATLEESLDCRLFDRLGKNIQLTQAGEALVPGYRKILAEIDESERLISRLREQVSGHLRFGTSHHIGLHRLPPVLREYTSLYTEVELDIRFMDSEQAAELILKGDIELALVTLPEVIEAPLTTLGIWSDPMQCVVAPDHALASISQPSRSTLFGYPMLLQSHNTHTRHIIESALHIPDDVKIIMESNYLETIKAMIQHGLGWGVLPDSMIDDSLQRIDISSLHMQRHLGALFHSTRTLSSPAEALIELIKR